MRPGSIARMLFVAGAGWLASNLWRNNTGGFRDRVTEGTRRLRDRGERLWEKGAERMRSDRTAGPPSPTASQHGDWRYYRPEDEPERRIDR